MKNSTKKVKIKALFLLGCCLLCCLLGFRLLCRCLLCCCHVVFHLLPERVISFVNLSINKYFGRKANFRHRIGVNNHFCSVIMARSDQKRIIDRITHEMRNPSKNHRITLNRNIWANVSNHLPSFPLTAQHMRRQIIGPVYRRSYYYGNLYRRSHTR